VRGDVARLDLDGRGRRALREARAELLREVGHLSERAQAPAVQRREDLSPAVRRLAQLFGEAFQLAPRQPRQMCRFRHRSLDSTTPHAAAPTREAGARRAGIGYNKAAAV